MEVQVNLGFDGSVPIGCYGAVAQSEYLGSVECLPVFVFVGFSLSIGLALTCLKGDQPVLVPYHLVIRFSFQET